MTPLSKTAQRPIRFLILTTIGLSSRYRRNVMQALAAPKGYLLQYRYEADLVDDGLRQHLQDDALRDTRVVLVFVDRYCNHSPFDVIPVRLGTLVRSSMKVGFFYVLTVRLEEWAYAPSVQAFSQQLHKDLVNQRLQALNASGELVNSWVVSHHEQPKEMLVVPGLDSDQREWPAIVEQLASTSVFSSEPFFYAIESLNSIDANGNRSSKPVAFASGRNQFVLSPGAGYELTVLFYRPTSDEHAKRDEAKPNWLVVQPEGEGLVALLGAQISVDSPYDLDRVRFVTRRDFASSNVVLAVLRDRERGDTPDPERLIRDIELPLRVRGSWMMSIGFMLLFAIFLASSQLVTLYNAKSTPGLPVVALTISLAVLTAATGVLGLRTKVLK